MGICLDTEQSDGAQDFEDGRDSWATPRAERSLNTPPEGRLLLQNGKSVAFETPKVPIIFVLGGPGSGKVTHCDNLTQEMKGVVHINMTDLLQQYAVGNDMQDFGLLSSKTVAEVLMLEIKMSPTAKTFLISGYPRNMRDVVEYLEKIRTVNGVILISWRQKVLERQIDYGAKLGQVVLSLAKMELNNFYKNTMPVADYFDQSNMLMTVNGERHPGDVYKDFRDSVIKILDKEDSPPLFDTISDTETTTNPVPNGVPVAPKPLPVNPTTIHHQRPPRSVPKGGCPPVLWVVGGPGSNKAALCAQAARECGWSHVSLGKLIRTVGDSFETNPTEEAAIVKDSISAGELVPMEVVMKMVEAQIAENVTAEGIILDGFPRDVRQANKFENKYQQKPTVILLDCSKLQLGRGRLDDSVTAFRRRLEIFRQMTLPLLKSMDNVGRLAIVDGDTDTIPVQEEFKSVVKEFVAFINDKTQTGELPLQENVQETRNALGKSVNPATNGIAHSIANGVNHMANGVKNITNGHGPRKSTPVIRNGFTNGDARRNYSEVQHMQPHI